MQKIIVTNATGSEQKMGELHASGMIEFENGEISHVLFEKQFNKTITKYVEPKKEEVKEPEVSDKSKKSATKKAK